MVLACVGAEKSGKNVQGDSWWETWQEVLRQDEWRFVYVIFNVLILWLSKLISMMEEEGKGKEGGEGRRILHVAAIFTFDHNKGSLHINLHSMTSRYLTFWFIVLNCIE